MTTEEKVSDFNVGDTIWWLDTRNVTNPRIKRNVIEGIEYEWYYCRFKYIINDPTIYVWSPHTTVAKSLQGLIDILHTRRVGIFEYNQEVLIVESDNKNISITKAFVKDFISGDNSQYSVGSLKDVDNTILVSSDNVYGTSDFSLIKETISNWLKT